MKNNIKAVAIIASNDDLRPALQNIKFTGEEAIATDGFILAKTDSKIPSGFKNAEAYKKLNKKQDMHAVYYGEKS